MRVAKPLQLVLGLALAGGTALVWQGAAMAETTSGQRAQTHDQPAAVVTDTVGPVVTITQVEAVPGKPVHDDAAVVATGAVGSEPADKSVRDTGLTKPAEARPGKPDEETVAPVGVEATSEAEPADSGPEAPDETTLPVPSSPVAETEGAPSAPVVVVAAEPENESPRRPIVRVLPILPTITGVAIPESGDLAASMPSLPVAAKQPVPMKSHGALGNLPLLMAGAVVPQSLLPQLPFGLSQRAMVGWGLVALLWVSLYVFTYGLWLKRGGFQHAARSDDPARDLHSSLFATPHLLGYGSMPPRRPSPIFVVADSEARQNSFVTLTERRISI